MFIYLLAFTHVFSLFAMENPRHSVSLRGTLTSYRFNASEDKLLVETRGKELFSSLYLCDINSGQQVALVTTMPKYEWSKLGTFILIQDDLMGYIFDANGKLLYSKEKKRRDTFLFGQEGLLIMRKGKQSKTPYTFFDAQDGSQCAKITVQDEAFTIAQADPQDEFVAVESAEQNTHLYSTKSFKQCGSIPGVLQCYSPDGSLLVSTASHNNLVIYSRTGNKVTQFPDARTVLAPHVSLTDNHDMAIIWGTDCEFHISLKESQDKDTQLYHAAIIDTTPKKRAYSSKDGKKHICLTPDYAHTGKPRIVVQSTDSKEQLSAPLDAPMDCIFYTPNPDKIVVGTFKRLHSIVDLQTLAITPINLKTPESYNMHIKKWSGRAFTREDLGIISKNGKYLTATSCCNTQTYEIKTI